MSSQEFPPSVVLAAGTCTGAGTTVALAEACRTLAHQVESGAISRAKVQVPEGSTIAHRFGSQLAVLPISRRNAIVGDLVSRESSAIYIGFADRLPLNSASGQFRIMVVQNPHLYQDSDAPSLGTVARRVRAAWARKSAISADLIICATDASRDALLVAIPELDISRIDVRPIRPQTPAPRNDVSSTIETLLLLGDLYSYKRFDIALDGITQWASGRSGSVRVVHCGTGRDDNAVEDFRDAVQRARSAGVVVEERGSVSHDAAMEELLAADVLVSASEVETQGLTIVESMSVGVPVLARGISPVLNVGGDAIETFDIAGGPAQIAAHLRHLEPQETRRSQVARGLRLADAAAGWNLLPDP